MNILFLNWKDVKNNEAGGAEIIAFEYARRLVKDGHTVTIFARKFLGAKETEIHDGVKIVRRGGRLAVYFEAFRYYSSLKTKPEIVIDMVNTLAWQTPLYVRGSKRIAYVNQLAEEVLYYEFSPPISQIANYLEPLQYLIYRSTNFVCYSESTKKDLIVIGIPRKNINTFSLGLDHKRYFPAGKKSKAPLFIFVARLVKMKRADLCIKAMKRVVADHPDAELMIVGRGPEEDRLQDLAKKLKLENNIKFVMKDSFFIDVDIRDLKVSLMQKAWVLLLPSVKEGWGMVVTEAAACGTPAIVSRVTGLVDSVKENKTGLILSKNPSEKELAEAMEKIIRDKKLRTSLSKDAISWSKKFSWNKSYSEFKNLILSNEK